MLICRDLVTINAENDKEGKRTTFVEFDRPYFQYLSDDPVRPKTKTNKGKDVLVDPDGNIQTSAGDEWTGTEPDGKAGKRWDGILFQEAVDYLIKHWGQDKDFSECWEKNPETGELVPKKHLGHVILLKAVSDCVATLWLRSEINAQHRPKPAVDPAVAWDRRVKAHQAYKLSMGKVISYTKAEEQLRRQDELEKEEEEAA